MTNILLWKCFPISAGKSQSPNPHREKPSRKSQQDVPDAPSGLGQPEGCPKYFMCLAEGSCGLSGDKGMRAPSPHTPLSRLDPVSWAELGWAVLVPMALKGVGCGDLGLQECTDTHNAGTQGGGDRAFQGYGSEGCTPHIS